MEPTSAILNLLEPKMELKIELNPNLSEKIRVEFSVMIILFQEWQPRPFRRQCKSTQDHGRLPSD